MSLADYTGYVAAICTTSAYAPQAIKVWRTRRTQDISLKAFTVLVTGQTLWLVYGVVQGDWPLILSNAVTIALTSTILWFKLRERRGGSVSNDADPSVEQGDGDLEQSAWHAHFVMPQQQGGVHVGLRSRARAVPPKRAGPAG